MIDITEKDNVAKLTWLLDGKEVADEAGITYVFTGFEVTGSDGSAMSIITDMDMDEYEIYIDARDEQINELKDIVKRQMDEIQKLVKKSKEPELRKAYRRLTTVEEAEVASFIKNNPKDTYTSVGKRFEISSSSAHRIAAEYKVRKIVSRSEKRVKSTK